MGINLIHRLYVFAFAIITLLSCNYTLQEPHSLTVGEGFTNPVGYYTNELDFSWKLPENVQGQSAYRITAASTRELLDAAPDLWDSGKVMSDQSIFVKYSGKDLHSRQQVYWRVMYWDQDGNPSEWSETAEVELGLLDNNDWSGKWISYPFLPEETDTVLFGAKRYNVQYLRKDFSLPDIPAKATLYVTAKGVFEPIINGEKIGHDIMPPGFTPYTKRIETLTYDVTEKVRKGENAVSFILAPGWFTERIGWSQSQYVEKGAPELLCQLEMSFIDGKSMKICSDSTWYATDNGPIRYSEIYDGEFYDSNLEMDGWDESGHDVSGWKPVNEENISDEIRLMPKRHETVKNHERVEAVRILRTKTDEVIFDIGQNIVGVPEINIPMKRGDTLTVRFAEMLTDDGRLYTESYRTALSTDYYVASQDGIISYIPKFTFHGFRYIGLSGFDASRSPETDWVAGIVQYSDFKHTGNFHSSDEMLNKLYNNTIWSHKGNSFDIPTDCPQRDERMGWTGDAQIFAPTAYYIADVYPFFAAWLQSLREEQQSDGKIPIVIPNVAGKRVSPGWGDAAVIIPWISYFMTGDTKILEDSYESMREWVNFFLTHYNGKIIVFDGFGDWLQPYSSYGNFGETSKDLIATAYCAHSVSLLIKTAEILGFDSDVSYYTSLLDKLKQDFSITFFDSDGKMLGRETQTGYLMALGFDLLTDEKIRNGASDNLIKLVNDCDNHLRTGFLGTPLIAPVLDEIGRPDLAAQILFQDTYPSWFFSIRQGATTLWERWNSYTIADGFGDAGMNSFNHYAYGSIFEWIYERLIGITPTSAGFKETTIAPYFYSGLTQIHGDVNTPYGIISSGWKQDSLGNIRHDIIIPPNTTARYLVPSETYNKILINGKPLQMTALGQTGYKNKCCLVINLHSGKYNINLIKKPNHVTDK